MVARRPQHLPLLLHLQHLRAMIHPNPAEASAEAFVAASAAGTSVVGIAVEVGIAAEVETVAEVGIAADGNAAGLESSVEETPQPAPQSNRAVAVHAGWLAEAGRDRTEEVVTDAQPVELAELSKQLAVVVLVLPSNWKIAGPLVRRDPQHRPQPLVHSADSAAGSCQSRLRAPFSFSPSARSLS